MRTLSTILLTFLLSLFIAVALTVTTNPAFAQAVITGHVLYAGNPITEYVTTDPFQFWIRDESTGHELSAAKVYSHGVYQISGVPIGQYGIGLNYGDSNTWTYPGSFGVWKLVTVPSGTDTLHQDLECAKIIHLLSPVDNANALDYKSDSLPTYNTTTIRFAWDSIAEATTYNYIVYLWKNQMITQWASGSTTSTEEVLSFGINAAGEHYYVGLYAYGTSGMVGDFRMNYADGSFGWGYEFIVNEPNAVLPEHESVIPSINVLSQNYPNPFNPSTTISYHLPRQSHVTLKIFDVLGREVAMLVNRVEEPGYKSVNFDAKPLPSGVYYYRLQAGNYIETKKLLLLR